jgi:hypothetical protein
MTWHEEQQGEDRKRRSRTGSSLAQFFKGQQSNSNKDDGVESVAAERPTKVVWVTVNDKTDQHVMRASLDIADEGLYNSIISILAGRDYLKLDKFKRRNRILNHRALEALQALAFLVEYCRASASKSGTIDLFVIDDASEARRPCVEFALKRINACPKACCRIKAASGGACTSPRRVPPLLFDHTHARTPSTHPVVRTDTLSYCPRIGTIR